jgi:hypothetical protein
MPGCRSLMCRVEFLRRAALLGAMSKRLLVAALALILALGSLSAVEPTNLSTAKQLVGTYVTSGEYGREVVRVAAEANKYLLRRIPRGIPTDPGRGPAEQQHDHPEDQAGAEGRC